MATEKRLIDANTLLKVLKHRVKGNEDSGIVLGTNSALEIMEEWVRSIPTVDAVEAEDMREFARDVAYQFGYYCQNGGRLCITHGGLSTLEWAFDILGWENPHPVPECECESDGCHEHATCGTLTADGYKRVCGRHFAKMDGDGNA